MPKVPDSIGIKISELGDAGIIKENDVVPINAKTDAGVAFTKATKINDLRQTLGFENAFLSVDAGLDATVSGDIFFVYESTAKLWVLQYQNNSGIANPIMGYDNKQVRLPTSRQIRAVAGILGKTGFDVIGKVSSFSELRTIKPDYEGQRIILNGYRENTPLGGGQFIGHIGTATDDGGIIAAGNGFYWQRIWKQNVVPQDFGIVPGSSASNTVESFNAFFSCGFPLVIPAADFYCPGAISIANARVSIRGAGEELSAIIFTGLTQGLTIIQDNPEYRYDLSGLSLKTNATPASGHSALTIDGRGQLSGIAANSSGMKSLPQRTKQRGTISDIHCSGINGVTAWAKNFDFISQMRQRCFNLTATGLDNFTSGAGIGIDLRGDGYCVDSEFTGLMFTNLEIGLRIPDYFEGLTVDCFKFVNLVRGIKQGPEGGVTVIPTNQTRILDPKFINGHINAVRECITCTLINTGSLTDLLLYRNPADTATPYAHVNITALSGVKINNITLRQIGASASTINYGLVLSEGYNNTISNVDAVGNRSTVRIGGNNNGFYSNTLYGIFNRNGTYGVEVTTYANSNTISDIKNYGGVGPAVNSASATQNFINYNTFIFGSAFTISGAASLTVSVDVTSLNLNDVPVSVRITDQITGGESVAALTYIYDKPASTKTSVVFRVTSASGSGVTATRNYIAEIRGF